MKVRPKECDCLGSLVVLKITPFFGTMASIVILLFLDKPLSLVSIVLTFTYSWVMFFVAYRSTFAIAWNIRAKKLRIDQNA